MQFTIEDFKKAQESLKPILKKTSLIYSDDLSEELGAKIYIKPENLQRTGAFKIRGAFNKIINLTSEERMRGIVTASAGNHAQGVALATKYAAETIEHERRPVATIVMPETTPLIKVEATEKLGATVVLHGDTYDDAYKEARRLEAETGATFVHPFDDREVIIGQGTIALEILDELPETDIILIPVGGGGLVAGIAEAAKCIKPNIQIIGVEPKGAPCMAEALDAGEVVTLDHIETIADGVAVKRAGDLTFELVRDHVDKIVTVKDTELMEALLFLIERHKLICENAGALSIAGLNKIPIKGKNVVSLVSGGNIDVITIAEMLNKGLLSRGRLFSFAVELPHKPGELLKISEILAESNANIIKLDHNQFKDMKRFKSVRLEVTIETHGKSHVKEIVQALEEQGYSLKQI